VVVYDGTTATVYRDGDVRDTVTITSAANTNRALYIGRYGDGPNGSDWWYGYFDEIRISDTVRTTEWIKTSFNTQNDPSSFYSVVDQ